MKGSRKYDLIIFGASAYTGQYVTEEVVTISKDVKNKGLTWAIAGRSQKKLDNVLKEASKFTGQDLSKIDTIVADVDNLNSLKDMARQAQVVLTIVGPYTLYGENVVKACIAEGTSCVDLSGEANFLEKMQVVHHDAAVKAGAYIVGACGLDSIPADCGITEMQQNFGDLNSVELFASVKFHGIPPKLHSGTYFSAIELFAREEELKGYRKLLFPKPLPTPKFPLENKGRLHYSKTVKSWCVPFPGMDVDLVKRSQYKLFQKNLISRPVQMEAYVKLPLILCILALMAGFLFKFLCKFKPIRHILKSYPRLCTLGFVSVEGSSREECQGLEMKFELAGEGWAKKNTDEQRSPPDTRKNLIFKCRDPGYSSTAIMMVQAALTILKESDKIPFSGGVFPPGAAFAQTTLVERINARGVQFKMEEPRK